jgi:hypothetical protein
MAISQEEKLLTKQKPNPAVQSVKRFGSMIKENIADPLARGISYANPINFAQRIPEYGRQIKEGVEEFDKGAAERFKQNPGRVIGTQSGIIGPEYPETRASIAKPNIPLRDLPGGRLPEGNVDALMGVNQTAPPVNLTETATQQPGYVSPAGVAGIRTATDLAANQPEQDIGSKIPETDIATLEGFKSKQDVLPGSDFNKANTEDYFRQTGYIGDDDPRMVKRRAEAEDVQARRMKFIADSEAGKFSSGSTPSISSSGIPAGGLGGPPRQLSRGNEPIDVLRRKYDQREQEQADATASAEANRQSAERIAGSRQGSAERIADISRGSAERIAGTKAQQLAGAKQVELKQKRDIATEKLTSTPKGLYADLFKIPGYMNLATTIDELPFDDPRRASLIESFDQIEGGMNYSAYTALKDRIAN